MNTSDEETVFHNKPVLFNYISDYDAELWYKSFD